MLFRHILHLQMAYTFSERQTQNKLIVPALGLAGSKKGLNAYSVFL